MGALRDGHANQHYVPAFLLRQWQTGQDDKLTAMRWIRGQLTAKRYKATSVAVTRHLYSLNRSTAKPDVQIERDFLGPFVDDRAAPVHQQILAPGGLKALTPHERLAWSHFLIAQMFRTPQVIADLRRRGEAVLVSQVTENPEAYDAIRGDAKQGTFEEWLRDNLPDVFEDLALYALPSLLQSKKLNEQMLSGHWAVRWTGRARFDLLLNERPLLLFGDVEAGDGPPDMLVLPISPRAAFVRCKRHEHMQATLEANEEHFVRTLNRATVSGGMTYVYATDARQQPLVEKLLRPPTSEVRCIANQFGDGEHGGSAA